MKQRLFCLALAAALLTGCGAPASQPAAEGTPDTAGSSSAPGAETSAAQSTAGLHVLRAGDEAGFYSAGSSLDAGLSRLNYVDYATLTAAPPVRRPGLHP